MKQGRASAAVLILVLGLGLHLVFRNLSAQLSNRFPHWVRLESPPEPVKEDRPVVVPPERVVQPLDSPGASQFSFPIPPGLTAAVNFWKKIYSVYDSNQVVLHDAEDLSVQYAVLDFHYLDNPKISAAEKEAIRSKRIDEAMERLKGSMDAASGRRLRTQTGLRDKFEKALKISGRYLPVFEDIFTSYRLPPELTRLVFVESLFQEKALSRVGAAGFWQFMPATGRIHQLKVQRLVDERYDPILATHAAAKLLHENYEALGSWPLAITAYNAGATHLKKASETLGTRDLDLIAEHYSDSFGFASRNFYAEFLAALDLSQHAEQYFGVVTREPPLEYDLITLPVGVTFPQLAFLSQISLSELETLNPSFAPIVFRGNYLLPAGTTVRISSGHQELFANRFLQFYKAGEVIPANLARTE